jgi:DNA invertase Pin-like site-specific DNA recombinase
MNTNNPRTAGKIVAYYRVSTKRQGESGLGLEGQVAAVKAYAASVGGTIVGAYKEVETGKNNDRPQLAKAIAHVKRIKGRLVIAKLDRLARNVAFTANLMDSGIDFAAADQPHANRLTMHILAAVAEDELRRISDRTKAALAAAKARGVLLGTHRPGHYIGTPEQHREAAVIARKAAAAAYLAAAEPLYGEVKPIIMRLRNEGQSLRKIAHWLNTNDYTTLRGSTWTAVQVSRVLGA